MVIYDSRKLFRCYESKIEESKKVVTWSQLQDTFGLSHLNSASEPQQLLNHQFSIYTVQVVYWMLQLYTWQPLSICAVKSLLGGKWKILTN